MTEEQYLKATNRVKITMALKILRDVLPGDDYGLSKQELRDVVLPLRCLEERLFSLIKIEEGK